MTVTSVKASGCAETIRVVRRKAPRRRERFSRDVIVQHTLGTAARRASPVGARENATCLFHPEVRIRPLRAVGLWRLNACAMDAPKEYVQQREVVDVPGAGPSVRTNGRWGRHTRETACGLTVEIYCEGRRQATKRRMKRYRSEKGRPAFVSSTMCYTAYASVQRSPLSPIHSTSLLRIRCIRSGLIVPILPSSISPSTTARRPIRITLVTLSPERE